MRLHGGLVDALRVRTGRRDERLAVGRHAVERCGVERRGAERLTVGRLRLSVLEAVLVQQVALRVQPHVAAQRLVRREQCGQLFVGDPDKAHGRVGDGL